MSLEATRCAKRWQEKRFLEDSKGHFMGLLVVFGHF